MEKKALLSYTMVTVSGKPLMSMICKVEGPSSHTA